MAPTATKMAHRRSCINVVLYANPVAALQQHRTNTITSSPVCVPANHKLPHDIGAAFARQRLTPTVPSSINTLSRGSTKLEINLAKFRRHFVAAAYARQPLHPATMQTSPPNRTGLASGIAVSVTKWGLIPSPYKPPPKFEPPVISL